MPYRLQPTCCVAAFSHVRIVLCQLQARQCDNAAGFKLHCCRLGSPSGANQLVGPCRCRRHCSGGAPGWQVLQVPKRKLDGGGRDCQSAPPLSEILVCRSSRGARGKKGRMDSPQLRAMIIHDNSLSTSTHNLRQFTTKLWQLLILWQLPAGSRLGSTSKSPCQPHPPGWQCTCPAVQKEEHAARQPGDKLPFLACLLEHQQTPNGGNVRASQAGSITAANRGWKGQPRTGTPSTREKSVMKSRRYTLRKLR